ncbi:MAG: sodium:solute symporter, partial [Acidobacteriota bacterium]|nr:sodium:solute symporter [Acidobacteriota bacterium]
QFVILLTGALLFVFYQFERPPVLFDPVTLAATRAAEPEAMAAMEARYETAFAERRTAALDYAEADGVSSETALRERYVAADLAFQETRAEAVRTAAEVKGEPWSDTNHVFPTFVFTQLPPGVVGLILIAVLAAAMSTVESELSALSTASVVDFYRRFRNRFVRGPTSDRHDLIAGRVGILFWGTVATGAALYMGRLGSAVEAVNRVGSFFYGPILGAFVLAAVFPNRGARRAFPAVLCGVAAVWAADLVPRALGIEGVSYLYYNLIGTAVTVGVGLLLGRVGGDAREAGIR